MTKKRVSAVPVTQQFTSSVALGELAYGAERAHAWRPELPRLIEDVVPRRPRVLPFDEA